MGSTAGALLAVASLVTACGHAAPRAAALDLAPAPAGRTAARTARPAPAAPTHARHMLYRVHGHGGTIYLLGSVHLLSPDAAVLPAEVDSVFAHAGAIAFETSLDTIRLRAPEMLARARFTGGATLRSTLSPGGLAKADSLLKLYGLSVERVNAFKPWFVSILMTQLVMQKAHFQAQYGVDAQLNARAKQAGKPVVGLEPVEFQMGLMDRIPPADQERMITMAPGPDSSARTLARIKDAWLAGRAATLDTLLNRAAAESPTLYAMMVADRNRTWIPRIEGLLHAQNDALVVVGAAHLVGADGLIALLRARGYTVDQM